MAEPYHHREDARVMPLDSAARIERAYQQAIQHIKRTRQFQLDPWASIATCADEHRVGNPRGSTTRDHGTSTGFKVGL